MMRIGIDLSPLAVRQKTGIPVYTQALVDHLIPMLPEDWELLLFTDNPRAVFPVLRKNTNWCVIDPKRRRTLNKVYWYTVALPRMLKRLQVDILHSPEPFVPRYRRVCQITTVHDLVPFLWPETLKPWWAWYLRKEFRYACRVSDFVIADSESTVQNVAQVIGNTRARVTAIPLGVSSAIVEKYATIPDGFIHQEHYVLAVGTIQPRKNYGALLDVMEQLYMSGRSDIKLKIAGSFGWNMQYFMQRVKSFPLNQCVEVLGYVNEQALNRLYEECRLYISLSINEGFGLPTLEAMARKTAVICADRPAQNEFVAGAGKLVPIDDLKGIAEAVQALWDDDAERSRLGELASSKASQYIWEEMAQRTLAVYLQAAERIKLARPYR